MRLAEVMIPSLCARMTASLMERERPKSSAFTTSRREPRLDAIVWRHCTRSEAEPCAQDEQKLLAFVQARFFWAEDIEALPFEFAEEFPIDCSHQFGGDHGTAVGCGEGVLGHAIKLARALGDAGSELKKALGIFQL